MFQKSIKVYLKKLIQKIQAIDYPKQKNQQRKYIKWDIVIKIVLKLLKYSKNY